MRRGAYQSTGTSKLSRGMSKRPKLRRLSKTEVERLGDAEDMRIVRAARMGEAAARGGMRGIPAEELFARLRGMKRRRHPATGRNAANLAAVVGGAVERLGPRDHVSLYLSKQLPELEGSIEVRGVAVDLSLADLTVGEARSVLACLVDLRRLRSPCEG